jgi:hypothetical protein
MITARAALPLAVSLTLCTAIGCEEPTPEDSRTSLPDDPGVDAKDPFLLALPATFATMEDRFATSAECALCHSNSDSATAMRDEAGNEIAPFNLWQGTMMANAARDPLWRAVVSAEIAATPDAKAAIEDKCMRCHTPMASEAGRATLTDVKMGLLTDESSPLNQLALDGVSCTVCHQIDPGNLGTAESWTGGFVIGNRRLIYGPHQNPAPGPMQNHVNYTPTYAPHVTESNLCATCHTVFTHALEEDGSAVDGPEFPEQTAFLEWQNSLYAADAPGDGGETCQSCHMPTVDADGNIIETRIARAPPGFDFNIPERSPFGRHLFVGANTLMPSILKDMRDVLQPQATDAAFDASIDLAKQRLTQSTAELVVDGTAVDGDKVSFDVTVHNLVGHKAPTGFPARRLWLRARVLDADGAVLFESGGFDERGRILSGGGELLDVEKAAGGFEPHHDLITRDDEVQIYESVMADKDGARTPTLLRAVDHLKDNRLLPLGFSRDFADYDVIKPRGEATGDSNFTGGQDTVRFEVAVDGTPASVEISLHYQSLGSRFAMDLFQVDTDEVAAFRYMWERADPAPVTVATTTKDL